jgi:putative PIN family toxin of toxin-antitoxin system
VNVVLDTNVFLAGVFFSGPPATILRAWREGRITLVVSPPIMDEYRRVMHELAEQFPAVDPGPPLELLAVHARLVEASPLPEVVCTDPTDDMFLACAIAGGSRIIVSGDKALLRTSGYRGIEVLTPRAFLSHI